MNTGPIKQGPSRWLPAVILASLLSCGWIDAVIAAEAVAPPAAEPASAGASTDAATPPVKKKKKKERIAPVDLVYKGDAVCTRCHDESDDFPVLAIAQTKHGVSADARTPTCISCHGESGQHLHVPPGQGGERPLPDFPFGKKTLNDVAAHNQSCVNCHQGDKLTLWLGSSHSRRDVACTQCHKLHTRSDQALSRATVSEMCMNCHTEKRGMINRPSRHPVKEGKMTCTDCHAPHGSAGPKLMNKDSVNETCYTCHMETRGPFLWNHLPVVQDCSICHNPHGTVIPNLLKQRPPFLCQQCHEPTSHRGNTPALSGTNGVGLTSPFGTGFTSVPAQARSCNNCHNNIHGGNNPTNINASGRLRR